MLNKQELKSFQEESVVDSWYNTRSEDLYILNEVDKKKIIEITKGEDTYQEIVNKISKIARDDKEIILEKIDKHCNKLVNIGGYENEKFYKVGFMDGINLIIECIGGKAKC
ncbi:MAG TPA: hypothetical protein OIM45_07700 [Clostridiaceae bacterium]|nr:hypothetical protein [Clostridiaceae bacterium]